MKTYLIILFIAITIAQTTRICPQDTDGDIDWPATTIPDGQSSITVSMSCPNGAEGSINRVCFFSRVARWRTAEYNCQCPENDLWPMTEGGSTAILSCRGTSTLGDATASRYCSPDYIWEDPIASKSCHCPPIDAYWPTTDADQVIENQCDVGTITKTCSVVGTWGETVDHDCFCQAEGDWPQTARGEIASILCGSGAITRVCNSIGHWEEPSSLTCGCAAENGYPETLLNTNGQATCDKGVRTSTCSEPLGIWTNEDLSNCFCRADYLEGDLWPETRAGSDSIDFVCGSGSRTRHCDSTGNWEDVVYNNCFCAADEENGWPLTIAGSIASAECENGAIRTRKCGVNGVWETPDLQQCQCPQTFITPATPAGQLATVSCQNGHFTRQCLITGFWAEETDYSQCQCADSTNYWPATSVNSYSYINCGEGTKKRLCSPNGYFLSDIDYSECYCVKNGDYPKTLANTDSTVSCSTTDPLNTKTRHCDNEGIWQTEDNSQCIVRLCPEDGIWSESNPGVVVVRGCSNNGQMTRTCNNDGTWSDINYDNCKCKLSGVEELYEIGTTYSQDCSSGAITYYCNPNTGSFDEPNRDACKCAADNFWEETPVGVTRQINCQGSGSTTRLCNFNGQWELPNTSECHCNAEDIWTETEANISHEHNCDIGFITRYCNEIGIWNSIEDNSCYCSFENQAYPLGYVNHFPCDQGERTQTCTNGHFTPIVSNGCYCSAEGEWSVMEPSSVATIMCADHGSLQRICTETGFWGEVTNNECSCNASSDGVWPSTPYNEIASVPCSEGFTGEQTRACTKNGWSSMIDTNFCYPYCYYKNEPIAVGQNVTLSCNEGESGMATMECAFDEETRTSSFLDIYSTCTRIMCPVDGDWPAMVAGGDQTLLCPVGYSGQYVRHCDMQGQWGEVVDECTRNQCPAENGYPMTPSMTSASKLCDAGYSGTLTRYCNENGEWSEEQGTCERLYCPPEGEWPRTASLEYASGKCPEEIGYTGTYQRLCTADGTWEPLSQGLYSTCTALPFNVKFYPDEGARYVSRRPTIRIYPEYMPFDVTLLPECQPTIYNGEEIHNLVLSTKRYTNAILLEMMPDEYLDYKSYTVEIPPCWKSSNNQNIPFSTYKYTISTGIIAPSAVTSITIVEDETNKNMISVSFVPSENKSGSPITEYILTFDPPVYAPISISGSETSFPSFMNPHVSSFNVFVIPRNSIGYGASKSATYTFSATNYKPSFEIGVFSNTGLMVENDNTKVNADIRVSLKTSISDDLFQYFAIQCSNTQNIAMTLIPFTSLNANGYVYSIELNNEDTTFTCYAVNTVNNLEGESTTYLMKAFVFPASEDIVYGPISAFTYTFKDLNTIEYSWNAPELYYSHNPIVSYTIRSSVGDKTETFSSTGLSQIQLVSNGVYTVSILAIDEAGHTSVPVTETITVEFESTLDFPSITTFSAQATYATVSFKTSTQIPTVCAIEGTSLNSLGHVSFFINLIYTMDTLSMEGQITDLTPSTTYSISCELTGITNKYQSTFTTLDVNDNNDVIITLPQDKYVYTAPLTITSQVPGSIYCQEFFEANEFSQSTFIHSVSSSVFDSQFIPIDSNVPTTFTVYDLYSDTSYYFYCAVRYMDRFTNTYKYNISPRTAIYTTTHYYPNFLQVIDIQPKSSELLSRKPTFVLTFNNQIDINDNSNKNRFILQCGAYSYSVQLTTAMLSVNLLTLTIPITDFSLPVNSECSISFNHYGAVSTISKSYLPSEVYDGILNTNVFNINGVLSQSYTYTTTSDNIVGIASMSTVSWSPLVYAEYALTFNEPTLLSSSFAYTIQCGQMIKHFSTKKNISWIRYTNDLKEYSLYLWTDLLPAGETCTISMSEGAFLDMAGNSIHFRGTHQEVSELAFSTEIKNIEVSMVDMSPEVSSINVPLRTSFTLTFNRPVSLVTGKHVTIECLSCVPSQSMNVIPVCDINTNTCTFKPTEFLTPSKNYEVIYDESTFKHAYGNEYVSASKNLIFTTADSDCSLDFIMEDWNDLCSCTNTGTHCQCSCGSTAVLRHF